MIVLEYLTKKYISKIMKKYYILFSLLFINTILHAQYSDVIFKQPIKSITISVPNENHLSESSCNGHIELEFGRINNAAFFNIEAFIPSIPKDFIYMSLSHRRQ